MPPTRLVLLCLVEMCSYILHLLKIDSTGGAATPTRSHLLFLTEVATDYSRNKYQWRGEPAQQPWQSSVWGKSLIRKNQACMGYSGRPVSLAV